MLEKIDFCVFDMFYLLTILIVNEKALAIGGKVEKLNLYLVNQC